MKPSIEDVATPALVIDAETVQRNIDRLAEYAARHDLDIRPHTKTHKSQRMAALQMAAGAVGLTAAKVGEAEVMAEAADDLLLAYPAVDPPRTKRLARLAAHKTVRVAVDSQAAAAALVEAAGSAGSTIGVLVDLDVGLGRTGVQSAAEGLKLAQYIDAAPNLRLDGILCYPGHVTAPVDKQEEPLHAVAMLLSEMLKLWAAHGLEARIISGGSTPTAFQSHLVPQVSEIRPGTYIFNDMNTVRGGFCTLEDCAARIVSTVVSTAVRGQMVIDAGSKTLTSDLSKPQSGEGHGYILEYPEARIAKLSEEHAQVDVRGCSRVPRVGERVTVVPNHICPCVNLQDSAWWRLPDGSLETLKIDARGKLS